jgi:pSer/pThr/pTyr-binding forkhead associated (FHA) protein
MGGVSANPPAEAQRVGGPFLLYKDGDDREQVFAFDPGSAQLSVGREPSSDLVLDWDGQVSRLHAHFERVGDDWTVVDDGLSRNGTFVNGERLSGRARLSDGDTVRFGVTTMSFRSPPGGEQPAPAAPGQTPPAVDLSSTQRRVLVALSRPYQGGSGFASPATDQQIADEVVLPVGAVRTHLAVLYAKLGVEELHPEQKRAGLVERAFSAGLISERDF